MTQATAFDAWKNFILVLAGVLAGDMFSSLGQGNGFMASIDAGIAQFLVLDKWHAKVLTEWRVPGVLIVLVVVYFVKCLHGILVGIFSDGFYTQLAKNPWAAMRLCFFATVTVVSLSFVPWFSAFVGDQRTLFMRGAALMCIVVVPTLSFVFFDLARFQPSRFWRHVKKCCSSSKSFDDVVGTWIVEDVAILLLLAVWWVIMGAQIGSEEARSNATLITLALILFIPSVFDYVANRAFFFGFSHPVTQSPVSKTVP